MELSYPRTFRWNFRSLELSFPGTFVPWNFRPLELSFARVKLAWNLRSLTLIILHPLRRPMSVSEFDCLLAGVKCMRSYGRRLQIKLTRHDTRLICSAERVSLHYVTVEGNDSLVTSKLTYNTEQCERKNHKPILTCLLFVCTTQKRLTYFY